MMPRRKGPKKKGVSITVPEDIWNHPKLDECIYREGFTSRSSYIVHCLIKLLQKYGYDISY